MCSRPLHVICGAFARLTGTTAAGGSGHRNRASLALVAYAVKLSEMQLLFALKRINGCVRASNAHTGPPPPLMSRPRARWKTFEATLAWVQLQGLERRLRIIQTATTFIADLLQLALREADISKVPPRLLVAR